MVFSLYSETNFEDHVDSDTVSFLLKESKATGVESYNGTSLL